MRAPQYGDFTDAMDYHSALNAVIAADAAFMELPASVRARFSNDAGAFVAFCSDPANRAEAEALGLVMPSPGTVAAPAAGGPGVSETPPAQSST